MRRRPFTFWRGGFAVLIPMLMVVTVVHLPMRGLRGQDENAPHAKLGTEFLVKHCFSCHASSSDKTDFYLDDLQGVTAANIGRWKEIAEVVKSGEMPPRRSELQPEPDVRSRFNDWLESSIRNIETQNLRDRGPVQLYRLTRKEYANTVKEMLGVYVDEQELSLCEDDDWHGIKRIGMRQSMSATHMEQYLATAEAIVEEAFPDRATITSNIRFNANELVEAGAKPTSIEEGRNDLTAKPRVDLWPSQFVRTPLISGRGESELPPGNYEFRIRVSGLANSRNAHPPHLVVLDGLTGRLLYEQDVCSPESEPVEIVFTSHLNTGNRTFVVCNETNGPQILARLGRSTKKFYSLADGYLPWQVDFLNSQGEPNFACLLLDSIEISGPITSPRVKRLRDQLIPKDKNAVEVQKCVERIASQAYRRPVSRKEIERLSEFVFDEIDRGNSLQDSMKSAIISVLCSREFLFICEGAPGRVDQKLTDWELATRLSYFLWSSMPDDELIQVANDGDLSNPTIWMKQVQRMVADPKSKRFARDFCRDWLLLEKVGQFKPNSKRYPEYDSYLERSMAQETVNFFETVFRENRSIREFVRSDWTVLNPRLARHYGIQLPTDRNSDYFRKVSLVDDDHRGGLLTHASVLSLTSDGLRNRPVHRGVWLYEQFLGRSIPPPPPNIATIEPQDESMPKTTFRSRLAMHTRNPNCAACHEKVDPLGFAFENYDAIGRWRKVDWMAKGVGSPLDVDSSGILVDGRKFDGVRQFQELLMDDIEEIHLALVRKLAAYAKRRVITWDDEQAIREIVMQSAEKGLRLGDLVEILVLSDFFKAQ